LVIARKFHLHGRMTFIKFFDCFSRLDDQSYEIQITGKMTEMNMRSSP
jgi:hypothetical protein